MSGEDGLGDPKAAFAAERAADLGPAVRVTSRAATRRRGGFRFTREPMVLGPDRLSPAAARQLLGDPELVVEIRDRDGGFVTLQGDDLSGHLAEFDAFLAAHPEMADAHADGLVSPGAKLGRDATAPFGGGRTGSGFVNDGGSPAYRAAVTGEPQPGARCPRDHDHGRRSRRAGRRGAPRTGRGGPGRPARADRRRRSHASRARAAGARSGRARADAAARERFG